MSISSNEIRAIAFYLPQYHPIKENDEWWGKGFTEWTNVGKARPLFHGHYQPKVPADLGYYDLRVAGVREEQARLAREAGIEGFCYWHYWFGNGKRLLDMPIRELLDTGRPDFPFCLGWANHSWKLKTWDKDSKKDRLLVEQSYPGLHDIETHFSYVSKAFNDLRYIRVDGKPLFLIWRPGDIPECLDFVATWKKLAEKSGLPGIYFVGFTYTASEIDSIVKAGFDSVVYDPSIEAARMSSLPKRLVRLALRELFHYPVVIKYRKYARFVLDSIRIPNIIPCILPNFDHTPRSGSKGFVLQSEPSLYEKLLQDVVAEVKQRPESARLLFIKSWNEWGEGNYLEPDLRYSHAYLDATRRVIKGGISVERMD